MCPQQLPASDRPLLWAGSRPPDLSESAKLPDLVRYAPGRPAPEVRLALSMLINPVQDPRPEVLVRKRRHQRTKMLHQRSAVSLILQDLIG